MGISPLFCCFKDKSPICVSITGLTSALVSGVFLFWAMEKILFYRDAPKALLSISFAFICAILVIYIILLVFSIIKDTKCIKFGKILCIILFFLCLITFVFILIVFIMTIKDYANEEKNVEGKFWGNSDWAVVTVPSILTLILLVIIALCTNYLYYIFSNDKITINFSVSVNQNTVTNNEENNIPQPGLNQINKD